MKRFFIGTLMLGLLYPHVSFARVTFSEVAWMGTSASQFGEWIELFNDGDAEVDLGGAVLYEGGGSTAIITLAKKISPKGYYVIERTTASSPDPVPGVNDVSGAFGGGGLNNSGESLVLKDKSGIVLDQLDASSGWPAGDASTKETMQRNGSSWVTAAPTPGASLPSGAGVSPGSGSGAGDASSGTTTPDSSLSSHAGPSLLAPILKPREVLTVQAGRDRLGFVGVPLLFEGKAFIDSEASTKDGAFSWTFGDGGSATGLVVEHAYQFPGEYIVVLNALRGEERSTARARVKIAAPDLGISRVEQGAHPFIEIINHGPIEVNLWKATLRGGFLRFDFPEDTIIAPGARVAFPKEVTGLDPKPGDEVALIWPGGRVGSSLTLEEQPSEARVADLQNTVQLLKAKVSELTVAALPARSVSAVPSRVTVSPQPALALASLSASSSIVASATPRVVAVIPKAGSGNGGIFSWPGRLFARIGGLIFAK